jgi:hypothetical protein
VKVLAWQIASPERSARDLCRIQTSPSGTRKPRFERLASVVWYQDPTFGHPLRSVRVCTGATIQRAMQVRVRHKRPQSRRRPRSYRDRPNAVEDNTVLERARRLSGSKLVDTAIGYMSCRDAQPDRLADLTYRYSREEASIGIW